MPHQPDTVLKVLAAHIYAKAVTSTHVRTRCEDTYSLKATILRFRDSSLQAEIVSPDDDVRDHRDRRLDAFSDRLGCPDPRLSVAENMAEDGRLSTPQVVLACPKFDYTPIPRPCQIHPHTHTVSFNTRVPVLYRFPSAMSGSPTSSVMLYVPPSTSAPKPSSMSCLKVSIGRRHTGDTGETNTGGDIVVPFCVPVACVCVGVCVSMCGGRCAQGGAASTRVSVSSAHTSLPHTPRHAPLHAHGFRSNVVALSDGVEAMCVWWHCGRRPHTRAHTHARTHRAVMAPTPHPSAIPTRALVGVTTEVVWVFRLSAFCTFACPVPPSRARLTDVCVCVCVCVCQPYMAVSPPPMESLSIMESKSPESKSPEEVSSHKPSEPTAAAAMPYEMTVLPGPRRLSFSRMRKSAEPVSTNTSPTMTSPTLTSPVQSPSEGGVGAGAGAGIRCVSPPMLAGVSGSMLSSAALEAHSSTSVTTATATSEGRRSVCSYGRRAPFMSPPHRRPSSGNRRQYRSPPCQLEDGLVLDKPALDPSRAYSPDQAADTVLIM